MSYVQCNELPTGPEALPAPENIFRSNFIGVGFVAARRTAECCLRLTVAFIHASANRTRLAGVLRRHSINLTAKFRHFGIKHAKEQSPALIKDGSV